MAKVTIVQGHPDPSQGRYNRALANGYANGVRNAGHDVRTIDVASLHFPILRNPEEFYRGEVPADVRAAQADIAWADHLAFFYPLWHGDVPALFKAFIEQVFRPGFALDYGGKGRFPKKLLTGKSARIVVTMGMPAFIYRTYFGAHSVRSLAANLRMCGIRSIHTTIVGSIGDLCDSGRLRWLDRMAVLAETDSVRENSFVQPALGVAAAGGLAIAVYLARAATTWAAYGKDHRRGDALIDRVMPEYDVRLRHDTKIDAPAHLAFEAIRCSDFERSPIIRGLFRTREMLLGGRRSDREPRLGCVEQLEHLGWRVVAEEHGRELVFAAATKPWEANPVFESIAVDEFTSFHEPGWVKIAIALRVHPIDDERCTAYTETRVQTNDSVSRERFRRYWALLSPGMELIRIVLLSQFKHEAEALYQRASSAPRR